LAHLTVRHANGNTLSNIFGGLEKSQICNIYCRREMPSNQCCSRYYHVTESDIIKGINDKRNIGRSFELNNKEISEYESLVARKEIKFLDFFRRYRLTIFLWIREMIWNTGFWKNSNLDAFLEKEKPDVIFYIGTEVHYIHKIQEYCQRKTLAKLCIFFTDDTYTIKSYWPIAWLYHLVSRNLLRENVKKAALVYGISAQLCEEYGKIFNREIIPLYKGGDFSNCESRIVSKPVKIVYGGNLLYGRWKTLGLLASALDTVNNGEIKFVLEIYTNTPLTNEINNTLSREGYSFLKNAITYEEMKKVLQNADIVLHVESFDHKHIKLTRLSFSTKIIDCMQSGSCTMAIGPSSIASINYLKKTNAALIATNQDEIELLLKTINETPKIILDSAKRMTKYAQKYHDINVIRELIKNDLMNLNQGPEFSSIDINEYKN
jgi:hypothetical protein